MVDKIERRNKPARIGDAIAGKSLCSQTFMAQTKTR